MVTAYHQQEATDPLLTGTTGDNLEWPSVVIPT